MPDYPREVLSAVQRILSSIRMSLDASSPISRGERVPLEVRRDAYLRFEEIRFAFRAQTDPRRKVDDYAIEELNDQLRKLVTDDRFFGVAEYIRYRSALPRRELRDSQILHPALFEQSLSVGEAIQFLIQSLDRTKFESPRLQEALFEPSRISAGIKRIVPKKQHIAPIQFDIIENRLEIVAQRARTQPEDKKNVDAARNELTDRGNAIVEQLERSNCDTRLLESFRDLQKKLKSEDNIIQLGLSNIACEVMRDAFDCELPSAVAAMMKSHAIGINMFIAQFSDWQQFSEQAALAEVTSADIPAITQAVDNVVSHLKNQSDLATPEVPQTLTALKELIQDPRTATRRAIFAVWRSLENLVIKVYRYGAEFIDGTMTTVVKTGSTVFGRAIVATLMAAALSGALAMTPVASGISQSAWIGRASELVRSQIDALRYEPS